MKLPIFETFYSIQGEGENTGMPACFVRLAGCNVGCTFCDEKKAWNIDNSQLLGIDEIVSRIISCKSPNVVITGGEPAIYDLTELTEKLQKLGLKTFLETSGVNEIKGQFSHITLSPKQNKLPLLKRDKDSGKDIFAYHIDSLKVVISSDLDFSFAEQMKNYVRQEEKVSFYLQPEWDKKETIIPIIIEYIKQNPEWNLSLQMHKYINVK